MLTFEQAQQAFAYDADTGELTWNTRRSSNAPAGGVAGCVNERGYRVVSYSGRAYKAHRLIWLIVNGAWPVAEIDHINGDRGDNRIANLREADHAFNQQNQRTAQRKNRSGLLGVSWHKSTGKWQAQIWADGKQINLGEFHAPDEAHAAYLNAKREIHPGCTI